MQIKVDNGVSLVKKTKGGKKLSIYISELVWIADEVGIVIAIYVWRMQREKKTVKYRVLTLCSEKIASLYLIVSECNTELNATIKKQTFEKNMLTHFGVWWKYRFSITFRIIFIGMVFITKIHNLIVSKNKNFKMKTIILFYHLNGVRRNSRAKNHHWFEMVQYFINTPIDCINGLWPFSSCWYFQVIVKLKKLLSFAF